MSGVVVDAVVPGDLPALHALYEELTGERQDFEIMRTAYAAIASDDDYVLYAARVDGAMVGGVMAIVCRKLTRDCRPFLVMENFVVAASQRRRGIGKALLERVERLAVERGCESIMFVSSARRPAAHAFYAAMGYEPEGVRGFRKKFRFL